METETTPFPFRFHVHKMSSTHVYVRLHKGQTIDDISEGLLEDCAQLVKANCIQDASMEINVVFSSQDMEKWIGLLVERLKEYELRTLDGD
ncbi:uncharacterized protein LOC115698799 [Cannabis sativa]|uniref:uncharacterized protein LOC115698799 n=1 Tax=Cannabis sativa TaxID=3483 RepID=UPI0029CAA652|nr:uncharacterized protein LOC115698799 [Cannabis sativa]